MGKSPTKLMEEFAPLAAKEAGKAQRRLGMFYSRDEILSMAYYGLAQAANRWEEYCQEHEYDPARMDYFVSYVVRRIRGAFLDQQRLDDTLSRKNRREANRTGDDSSFVRQGEISTADENLPHTPTQINPEDNATWNAIAEATIATYLALPPSHQVVLAYLYLKEPKEVWSSRMQRICGPALKKVVQSALDVALDDPPLVDPGLNFNFTAPDLDQEMAPFLERTHHTLKSLTEEFTELLLEDPGTIADLARHIKPITGYANVQRHTDANLMPRRKRRHRSRAENEAHESRTLKDDPEP